MQPMGENFFEKRFTITKVYLRLCDIKPFWKNSYFILARGKPLTKSICAGIVQTWSRDRRGWVGLNSLA